MVVGLWRCRMPKSCSGTWRQQMQKAAALTLPPASAQLLHLPYQHRQGVSTHPGHLFLCGVCRRSRHWVTSPGSVTGVQLTSPYASSIWDIGQWLPGSRCQEDSSSPVARCRRPQASWPGPAADLAVFPPSRWKLCWEGEATAVLGWFSCTEAKQCRKQLPASFTGGHGFAGSALSSQLVEGLVISMPFGERAWRPGKPHPRLPGVGGDLRTFCWCVPGLLAKVGFRCSRRGCCEAEAGTCCSSPPCSTAFSSTPDDGR